MTSKTPESVVCHSPNCCAIVNSSNKEQQRNNINYEHKFTYSLHIQIDKNVIFSVSEMVAGLLKFCLFITL